MPKRKFIDHSLYDEDRIKRELCNEVRRALTGEAQTLERLAKRLGTSRAVLSYVINERTRKVTFNQLMRFLIKLRPEIRILAI